METPSATSALELPSMASAGMGRHQFSMIGLQPSAVRRGIPTVSADEYRRRFESKYIEAPRTGCFEWTATRDHNGYGKFRLNGVIQTASRVSWKLFRGEIPTELSILHRCDNPTCVNPKHLFLGTTKDNLHDMARKGRRRGKGPKGEINNHAKLTSREVIEMRSLFSTGNFTHENLAKKYGVLSGQVYVIVTRRQWKHI